MNEEIKKTLHNMLDVQDITESISSTIFNGEIKKILLLIQNLEEENQQLKEKIDSMTESYEIDAEAKFYEYVDKHESKLQQRIDKIFSRITLYKMEDITMETARVLDELLKILKGEPNND